MTVFAFMNLAFGDITLTDFDWVSAVLAAAMAADAYIAFRWAMAIMTLVMSFWWVMPIFIRRKVAARLQEEQEHARRRLTTDRG